MADDAAHIPARPEFDRIDTGTAPASTSQAHDRAADDIAAVARMTDVAADAASGGEAVEVVGRHAAPAAMTRSRQLVAAGSAGADEPALTDPGRAQPERSPWSGPRVDVLDDAPRWSFPGRPDAPPPAEPPPPDRNQSELTFPEAAGIAAASAPPRAMPLFGPVGRTRSAILVPVLSALTLGIYALGWHHAVNREMEEFDPKLHSRPRRSLAAVLLPWLAGLLVTMAGAGLVITARLGVHLPFDPHVTTAQAWYLLGGLAAVPYLVLVLPFSIVAVVMTLERLRSVEEHVGATTDRQVRPVGMSLLLAIPVVGGLILLGLEQRRLNAVWQAGAPSGRPYS